jgi:hypothetical protein
LPNTSLWDHLTSSDWDAFVKAWLAELRMDPPPPEPDDESDEDDEQDLSQSVVLMSFTARPDQQWQFICSAVAQADSDGELGQIAAGPMEHLLGWHGKDFIARVETRAAADEKFARMLTGVWKYMMTDEVWARVQAIQATVPDSLPG